MSTVQPAAETATVQRGARIRSRWVPPPAAMLLTLASVLFVIYPVVRPYSSESGLAGALAFGSDRWVLAHVSGMAAFGCLAAAICSLTTQRLARVCGLLGVALILPYYGAEAFGLRAIGVTAVNRDDASLTGVSTLVRNNPAALTMFCAGWMVLAIAGVALARVLWVPGRRTSAALVGAGMVLYLPQFFGPPRVRIAHGALLGVGLAIVAVHLTREPPG